MEELFNLFLGMIIFFIVFLIYPIIIKLGKKKYSKKDISKRLFINSLLFVLIFMFLFIKGSSITLSDVVLVFIEAIFAYFLNLQMLKSHINIENENDSYEKASINSIVFIPYILTLSLSIIGFYNMIAYIDNNLMEETSLSNRIIPLIILLYLFVWSILKLIQVFILKSTTILEISTKKVFGKKGWLNTISLDAPINKINDVMVVQSFLGKIFNYGTIIINTSSNKYKFQFIENADKLKNKITSIIDKKEQSNNENINKEISTDKYSDLKKLKELLDNDIITKEEFEKEKEKILK